MDDSIRLDHAVVLVRDLAKAVAEYGELGFTVTPGGVHAGGTTRNAIIPFADGSYLELITFTSRLTAMGLPWLGRLGLGRFAGRGSGALEERFRARALGGLGLIDFALGSSSIEADLARLRREGIRADGPHSGGRRVADGTAVEWALAVPGPPELPFLCEDRTERALRVPDGEARIHPNGVGGIAGITVAVESVETSSARYRTLLGREPEPGARERLREARGRIFRVGEAEIVVATATDRTHPLRRHLNARGEGPIKIHLRAPEVEVGRFATAKKALGAWLDFGRDRG